MHSFFRSFTCGLLRANVRWRTAESAWASGGFESLGAANELPTILLSSEAMAQSRALEFAQTLLEGFDRHYHLFRELSSGARHRFTRGHFPAGLKVGRVVASERTLRINPFADLDRLEHVSVLIVESPIEPLGTAERTLKQRPVRADGKTG